MGQEDRFTHTGPFFLVAFSLLNYISNWLCPGTSLHCTANLCIVSIVLLLVRRNNVHNAGRTNQTFTDSGTQHPPTKLRRLHIADVINKPSLSS